MTIQRAREKAEQRAGRKLDEAEFRQILEYTRHKAAINGKDEDYVPLLLMDEIKNHFFQTDINRISRRGMEIQRGIQAALERGEWPCVTFAAASPA